MIQTTSNALTQQLTNHESKYNRVLRDTGCVGYSVTPHVIIRGIILSCVFCSSETGEDYEGCFR